jgi:hypothetical protein
MQPGAFALLLHRCIKPFHIHIPASPLGDKARQVRGKPQRIVPEGNVTQHETPRERAEVQFECVSSTDGTALLCNGCAIATRHIRHEFQALGEFKYATWHSGCRLRA